MTENEAIELHIAENLHRIEVIEEFLRTNSDADDKECKKNIQIFTKINGVLQEIQQYRAVGTVRECSEAVKKQKPEKPLNTTKVKTFNGKAFAVTGTCPVCNSKLVLSTLKYCYICGQAIDRGVADETST